MARLKLIKSVAREAGITQRQADKALTAFINTIIDEVSAGNSVIVSDFGIFSAKHRPARTHFDLSKGENGIVPARTVPSFKPGKAFKVKVNK